MIPVLEIREDPFSLKVEFKLESRRLEMIVPRKESQVCIPESVMLTIGSTKLSAWTMEIREDCAPPVDRHQPRPRFLRVLLL
jgi:hypothetical protein